MNYPTNISTNLKFNNLTNEDSRKLREGVEPNMSGAGESKQKNIFSEIMDGFKENMSFTKKRSTSGLTDVLMAPMVNRLLAIQSASMKIFIGLVSLLVSLFLLSVLWAKMLVQYITKNSETSKPTSGMTLNLKSVVERILNMPGVKQLNAGINSIPVEILFILNWISCNFVSALHINLATFMLGVSAATSMLFTFSEKCFSIISLVVSVIQIIAVVMSTPFMASAVSDYPLFQILNFGTIISIVLLIVQMFLKDKTPRQCMGKGAGTLGFSYDTSKTD